VSFCPTGGLTLDDFTQYLALPNVACVGGSWLVPKAAVDAQNWQAITDIAKQTTAKLTPKS
jgi:2-dehydro-3-deoxyphosphogluconate aldolase/(4S)-4-hydroxy-2-oxoglutarate aldolase